MYKNNYILKLFQYMGVGIWGKKHGFIHSQRFKTIIKQQDINIIESKADSLLDMQSRNSLRNGKVLQSKIVCHTTALAEVSNLESKQDLDSKKDISPSLKMTSKQSVKDVETNVAGITHKTANMKIKGIKTKKDILPTAQYDKVLESKQNLISKQNLESCNFAPLRPAPTHLDKNLESKNCHVEQSKITLKDSKWDISCLRTRTSKALAHTCKYDKVLEFKTIDCHIERSEISSQDSKKDFSLSLKMTRKHKMTKMLFPKMTSKQKTTNIKKDFSLSLKMTKKHKTTKMLFLKMTK